MPARVPGWMELTLAVRGAVTAAQVQMYGQAASVQENIEWFRQPIVGYLIRVYI
jgi:hypothetical protein